VVSMNTSCLSTFSYMVFVDCHIRRCELLPFSAAGCLAFAIFQSADFLKLQLHRPARSPRTPATTPAEVKRERQTQHKPEQQPVRAVCACLSVCC
jgi:hypothetical protein